MQRLRDLQSGRIVPEARDCLSAAWTPPLQQSPDFHGIGQTFTTQYIKINMVVDYCRLLLAEALYLSDMIGVESAEKIAAAARVPNLFGQVSFVIIYYINLYKLI